MRPAGHAAKNQGGSGGFKALKLESEGERPLYFFSPRHRLPFASGCAIHAQNQRFWAASLASSARNIFSGVMGKSVIQTPIGSCAAFRGRPGNWSACPQLIAILINGQCHAVLQPRNSTLVTHPARGPLLRQFSSAPARQPQQFAVAGQLHRRSRNDGPDLQVLTLLLHARDLPPPETPIL